MGQHVVAALLQPSRQPGGTSSYQRCSPGCVTLPEEARHVSYFEIGQQLLAVTRLKRPQQNPLLKFSRYGGGGGSRPASAEQLPRHTRIGRQRHGLYATDKRLQSLGSAQVPISSS
jgi:hypothetical protein